MAGMWRPARRVEGLSAYEGPGGEGPISLDLSGTCGPRLELAAAGSDAAAVYPEATAVQERLAELLGVTKERVLVTAGADDALDRLARVCLEPGRSAIVPRPGFSMTERYVALAGGTLVPVAWPGAGFPRRALLQAVGADTSAVFLTSPNNPTGAVVSPEDLRAISEALPEGVVVLDVVYGAFADGALERVALALPNVVVVGSLSKGLGLPGLRVGWAVGPEPVVRALAAVGQPYAVAGPSLAMAFEALDRGLVPAPDVLAALRGRRRRLEELLADAGLSVVPSQASFVCARSPRASWWASGLAGLGIRVRLLDDGAGGRCLRVGVPGDDAALALLERALAVLCRPEAFLWDMDGVLVDVSTSYRAAIEGTVAAFGGRVSAAGISAAKTRSGVNNDWMLSRALLADQGIEVSLAEVTAVFEALYQGTGDTPGLWTRETPLIAPEQLGDLSGGRPMAVVTGRPRRDAERFARTSGIARWLPTMVCMEDGPPKPDPAPVRLALASLGVQRAWMVGDTPDDIRAARAAGVLPVGVLGPGAGPGMAAAMRQAGAAFVLDDVSRLREVWP